MFYTINTSTELNEIVYYCGMVGIVATWKQNSTDVQQRFFFGHDNDIQCIAIHPNRRFVATGQQKNTGSGKPYCCIWDIGYASSDLASNEADTQPDPVQLQRIEVDADFRAILAVAFSGNPDGPVTPDQDDRGGELLITISGDNKHTVHIWRWMVLAEPRSKRPDDMVKHAHVKAIVIPSWHYGPDNRLGQSQKDRFYCSSSSEPEGPKPHVPGEVTANDLF